MYRLLYYIFIIFLIIACSEEDNLENESFLRVRKKIIEYFNSKQLKYTETILYYYKTKADFFWEKSVKISTLNKDTILTLRYFDEKIGLPIKEIIYINGVLRTLKFTKYSKDNFELIESSEYQIENNDTFLISKLVRNYFKGYLISEKFEQFSKNFINKNNSNLIKSYKIINLKPNYFLPKGYYLLNEFYQYFIEYQNDTSQKNYGDTLKFIYTHYDKKGFPEDITIKYYDNEKNILFSKKYWLVNELNKDSLLIGIIAYSNENRNSLDEQSYKIFFITNNNLISEIQKYYYNRVDKDFNKFNEMKVYKWYIPEFYSRYNFSDYDYSYESYNYTDSIHYYSTKNIVRWDDVGLKVIEIKEDSYKGQYESKDFSPKLTQRITYIFDKIEKIGPKLVFKRNKKY